MKTNENTLVAIFGNKVSGTGVEQFFSQFLDDAPVRNVSMTFADWTNCSSAKEVKALVLFVVFSMIGFGVLAMMGVF